MSEEYQSENSGDDDVEEIKIADVKDKIIKQQNEEFAFKKKERKKKSKKKKNKENLFDKYKEENAKDKLNEEEMQSVPLLLNQKKVRNAGNSEVLNNRKQMYIKNSKRLIIEDDEQSEEFDSVKENINEFKNKHFFGDRIIRCTNFITKI